MTFAMSENTIEAMERSAEAAGYNAFKSDNDGISKTLNKVLRELHYRGTSIEEVRPNLNGWYLYLGGVLKKEDREKIANAMSEKTGFPAKSFNIVAFYN